MAGGQARGGGLRGQPGVSTSAGKMRFRTGGAAAETRPEGWPRPRRVGLWKDLRLAATRSGARSSKRVPLRVALTTRLSHFLGLLEHKQARFAAGLGAEVLGPFLAGPR